MPARLTAELPEGSAHPEGGHADAHHVSHLKELDGLRGLLALSVAVSHIVLWCAYAEVPVPARFSELYGTVLYSQWAVEVFFILSGFAISFLIYSRKQPFPAFMVGRFFRIYPVYLFCVVVGLATAGITPFVLETATWRETTYFTAVGNLLANEEEAPWLHLANHLTLLHGAFPRQLLPGSAGTVLVPAWSISVEWQYYLCALLIARFTRSPLGLLALAGGAWLAARYGQPWVNPLRGFFPLVLPFFLFGIASYHLYVAFMVSGAKRSWKYALVVAAVAGAAVLFRWHTLTLVTWVVAFGSLFVEPVGWAGRVLCWIRTVLAAPVMQWLGRISYPLYLVHWPLIIIALGVLLSLQPDASSDAAVLWMLFAALPVMLAVSHLLHRTIELPMMRVGKRWSELLAKARLPRGRNETALPPVGARP